MEKLNKLSLPVTILIASIVLGGFYYASEANKQESIERQHKDELQAKKEVEQLEVQRSQIELQAKKELENTKKEETINRAQKLSECLINVDNNYQANFESYCISEGRGPNCPSIKFYNNERVLAIEKTEKEDCYKQYK